MAFKEQKLTMAELEKYISEWISGIMPVKSSEQNGEVIEYLIIEPTGCSVVYSCLFNKEDYKGDDKTICSTACITNEELRGLIEKTIELDKQLNASKAKVENAEPQKA